MSDIVVENSLEYNNNNIIEENLFNYLKQLDERIWRRLFMGRASLRAIFRSLNELEQLIIYRLLYIQQPVSERALRLWMSNNAIGDLRKSLSILQSYNIIQIVDIPSKDGKQQYKLHKDFKNGFIELLSDGSNIFNNDLTLSNRYINNINDNTPTIDDLITHAKHKLDFLLLFLVSPNARKNTLRVNKLTRKLKKLKKINDDSQNHQKKSKHYKINSINYQKTLVPSAKIYSKFVYMNTIFHSRSNLYLHLYSISRCHCRGGFFYLVAPPLP